MTVETGSVGSRNYSMKDRYGKCEFIHPETAVLLDQTIPKELRENRCFQSKSAEEQKRWLGEVSAMPRADFEKTMKDLSVINASDRLTGAKGCETSNVLVSDSQHIAAHRRATQTETFGRNSMWPTSVVSILFPEQCSRWNFFVNF